MDFHLTNEQQMLRKMYREFAENEVKPLAEEIDEEERFPMETVEKMAKLGMMGIYFPKEYGGAGGDVLSYAMCVEELAKVCGTTAVIVSAHTSLCCAPIFEHGTEEQKRKYLPDLLSGKKIGAFGLTEPNAGTDASGQQTLDGGRIGIAAQALGLGEGAVNEAVKYTQERVQFGKRLSQFQNTQFQLADMHTRMQAAQYLVYAAAMKKQNHEDYSMDASMAKLFAAEAASDVTRRAVQLFGGYGYTREYPVERMMRDAKITEIYEGTSEVQRMVISSRLGVK